MEHSTNIKTIGDISYSYTTKLKILNSGNIKIVRYKKLIGTLKEKEKINDDYKINRRAKGMGETRKRDLNKSRDKMMSLILHNNDIWRSFATYTFAKDITRDDAMKCWDNYVRQVRRHDPSVVMIKIDEFTKNGRPHFHVLTNIECGSELYPKLENPKNLYNPKTKTSTLVEYAEFKYWKHGFTQAKDITKTDDNFNIALYMAKYMMKDFDNRHYNKMKYTVINRKKLEQPRDIKINELNSDKITQVIKYLSAKGYDCNTYEYISNKEMPFLIDYDILDYKINQIDLEELKNIFTEL